MSKQITFRIIIMLVKDEEIPEKNYDLRGEYGQFNRLTE